MTTMTKIQPFTFNTHPVRVEMQDGQPWFVLADVCKVLEVKNPRQVASRLDDDEKDAVTLNDAIGRPQEMTVVNESGLYAVILRSDKPQAKAFRKWVTSEVLPSLRQTGTYTMQPQAEAAPTENVLGLTALEHIVTEFKSQKQQLQTIEKRLDSAPITSEKVGSIYRLGQQLGQVMGSYSRAWKLFKDHFGLASYRDLPTNRFDEAVHFLRMQIMAYTGQPLPDKLI